MPPPSNAPTRRGALLAGTVGLAAPLLAQPPVGPHTGRLRQSIVQWCFSGFGEKWSLERTCQAARELGCKSIELVGPDSWDTLRRHGLTCAIAPNGVPGKAFMRGLNNPRYRDEVVGRTLSMIDACADAKVPSVIAFTGYKWRDANDPASGEISADEGAEHCVKALKELAVRAEKRDVTVCVEHLNSRDSSHPMRGHPGYQGDRIDYVCDIVRRAGSPRVKVLFDVYHVQIMDGDLIRHVRQHKDVIGHVHTAGNPGRGELDDTQEIHYPAVMKALADAGYEGYVGHEFMPTREPMAGLRQAVAACAV